MKRLLFVALSFAAAPVHAQTLVEPRSEEERGALFAYSACLYGFAREMDDGTIAALTLSRKVAPKCRFQLSTAASILSRGKPRAARDALYQQWLAQEDQQGVRIVRTMRLDRRATKVDPANPRQGKPAPRKPVPAKPVATASTAPKAGSRAIPATASGGEPMSAWRRAYIAKHGREPEAPAKRVAMQFAIPKAVPRPISSTGPGGKPMSAWRRAYIAKHGHEPPVRAK